MSGHSKWANIKHRKSREDAKKGKTFTKIGREIMVAVKSGGPDAEANSRLKAVIQKARSVNMPMENIMRTVKKASGEADGVNYEELVYEGYGPGGIAVMATILTDNRNRTAGEIRHIFSKNGGSLGETGCVSWIFEQKGVIIFDQDKLSVDVDQLLLLALDAGADDVNDEEDSVEVICSPELLNEVKEVFEVEGLIPSVAEVTMVPQNTVEVSGDAAVAVLKLVDMLEDNDDVQEVYTNFEIMDDELANL